MLATLLWDYDDNDLIKLCNHCHGKTHAESKIPIFDKVGNMIVYSNCSRCSGTGWFPEYLQVYGGVYF